MPDLVSPVDGTPWPQGDYYDDAPLWSPSGVVDSLPSFTGSPLTIQPTYGVGALALSFSVAGSVITAALDLGRARVRGMRYRRTGTPWTQTIALNSSGNPRRDRIVLRRDLAAKTCTPVWLQGTPAVSPTSPALTQVEAGVWDVPMYSFTVPASSSTSITLITDERTFVSADGGGILCPTISGTFTRTDGTLTINANTTTDLTMVVLSQAGPWTVFNGSGGVGVQNTLIGRYRLHGLVLSDIAASRWEQLNANVSGTSWRMGTGGSHKTGFGGAGGVVDVDCPAGFTGFMQHVSDGASAGTIRTGNRWSAEFLRPLT